MSKGGVGDSIKRPKVVSSAALTARYCTDMHTIGACTFAHLRGRAAAPSATLHANTQISRACYREAYRHYGGRFHSRCQWRPLVPWGEGFSVCCGITYSATCSDTRKQERVFALTGGRTELSQTIQDPQKRAQLRTMGGNDRVGGEHCDGLSPAHYSMRSTAPADALRRGTVGALRQDADFA